MPQFRVHGYMKSSATLAHIQTPPGEGPEQRLMAREAEATLEEGIHQLPPPLRAVLLLHVLAGRSPNEIARIYGCTRATVYWRLHRARKLLKDYLARVEGTENGHGRL